LLEIAIGAAAVEGAAHIEAGSRVHDKATGATTLVPFTNAMVPIVDIASGKVVVDPPAELLNAELTENIG